MGSIRPGVAPLKSGNVGFDSSSFILRTRAEGTARESEPLFVLKGLDSLAGP